MTRCVDLSVWPVLLLLAAGCAPDAGRTTAARRLEEAAIRSDRLASSLQGFTSEFQAAIEQASEDVEEQAQSRGERKAALLWKVRMTDRIQRMTDKAQPLAALLDAWTLCVRQTQYLESGDGRSLFGGRQPLAVAVARDLQGRIEEIARDALPADRYADIQKQVTDSARQQPLIGMFSDRTAPSFSQQESGQEVLTTLLGIPFAPFLAIGKLTQTPDSIRDLAGAASRFTDVIEGYPEETRWQLQLLAMELEESPAVATSVSSLERISQSSARYADIAEKLPSAIRREGELLIDGIGKQQPALQATLTQAHRTTESARQALVQADAVAEKTREVVQALGEAGRVWGETAGRVNEVIGSIEALRGRGSGPQGPQKAPASAAARLPDMDTAQVRAAGASRRVAVAGLGTGLLSGQEAHGPAVSAASQEDAVPATPDARADRGFDILDYKITADSIGHGAVETRALLGDLRGFIQSDDLPASLRGVNSEALRLMDESAARLRGLVDVITLRIGLLMLVGFVLALLYRWLTARMPARGISQHEGSAAGS